MSILGILVWLAFSAPQHPARLEMTIIRWQWVDAHNGTLPCWRMALDSPQKI